MFRMYIVTQLPPLAKAKGGSFYNEIVYSQLSLVGAKEGESPVPAVNLRAWLLQTSATASRSAARG